MRMIFAAVLAAMVAGCATAPDPLPTGELTFEQRFRWVAFHDDQGHPIRLHRWEDPINAVALDATDDELYLLRLQLTAIEANTGLPFHLKRGDSRDVTDPLRPPDGFNLSVRFGTETDLLPTAQIAATDYLGVEFTDEYTFTCFGIYYPHQLRVTSGIIIIRRDLSDAFTQMCVAQEVTQILGLTGDLDRYSDSVFNSYAERPSLSASDWLLVRILFNDRLRAGMTADEAMPTVRRIIAENGW